MSKVLEKDRADLARCEAELRRKAESHVAVIRRAVQEYAAAQAESSMDSNVLRQKQREIERAVAAHTQLHKAIRRVRKQIQAGIRPSNAKAS